MQKEYEYKLRIKFLDNTEEILEYITEWRYNDISNFFEFYDIHGNCYFAQQVKFVIPILPGRSK